MLFLTVVADAFVDCVVLLFAVDDVNGGKSTRKRAVMNGAIVPPNDHRACAACITGSRN